MTEITLDLIETLRDAQLRHLRDTFLVEKDEYNGIAHSKWSDDGYDYLRSALRLSSELVEIFFDRDLDRAKELFDPESDEYVMHNFASDGICDAICELLPEEE